MCRRALGPSVFDLTCSDDVTYWCVVCSAAGTFKRERIITSPQTNLIRVQESKSKCLCDGKSRFPAYCAAGSDRPN